MSYLMTSYKVNLLITFFLGVYFLFHCKFRHIYYSSSENISATLVFEVIHVYLDSFPINAATILQDVPTRNLSNSL